VELSDSARKGNRREAGDPFLIGSSGRFFPVKDYPLFVRIAQIVKSRGAPIRFELAGDGARIEEVEALIGEFELGDMVILKRFLHEMLVFYRNLDLYLNTSIHEWISMSVLEAMAYGLPVIVPNIGGFKEIIDDGIQGHHIDGRIQRNSRPSVSPFLRTGKPCMGWRSRHALKSNGIFPWNAPSVPIGISN
jgi:glycosyltransferase involved in cell wall biosynthesis